MNELIKKVEQWAIDRNLHVANPQAQALKVVEEFTEMLMADQHNDVEDVIDGIGDTYVTLIILYKQLGMNFMDAYQKAREYEGTNRRSTEALNWLVSGVAKQVRSNIGVGAILILKTLNFYETKYNQSSEECLSVAYSEIKDRTGKMVNGTFIKSEDLQ